MDGETRSDAGAGEPDAFMRAQHAQLRRQVDRGLRVALVALAVVVLAAVVALVCAPSAWYGILPIALTLACGAASFALVSEDEPERPEPDTPLGVARAVGSEIVSWGNPPRSDWHTVRVIGELLGDEGQAGPLVHGYRQMPASGGCHVTPGTAFGFRRYPTMEHLVWLEPDPDRVELAARDAAAQAELGLVDAVVAERIRSGTRALATILAVRPGGARAGPRWRIELDLRLADGRPGTATGYHLPEELALLAPGEHVDVVLLGSPDACVVLPLPA